MTRSGMTIDLYLKQAGIRARSAENKKFIPIKPFSEKPFDHVLDTLTSKTQPEASSRVAGKTIADYLSGRIPTNRFSTLGIEREAFRAAVPEARNRQKTDAIKPEKTTEIDRCVKNAAEKYNLSETLIRSVIQAESGFRADAVSPAGARGLMQLMPATAKALGVTDSFDIEQNIDGGAKYIRQMLDRFNGDIKLALAAYNAGPGTVERYNGDVPYKETRNYIQKVLSGLSEDSTPA